MTPEALAQIAYEAWCASLAWRDWSGKATPRWTNIQLWEQQAWIASAQAVKANVLSGFTKVGEGSSVEDL